MGLLRIEKNKIYFMDCLEGMKYIEDNSVDLVLSDPPYNISRSRKFSRDSAKDITMDFGEWDNQDEDKYLEWFEEVLKEWKRVLKDKGQILVFGDKENWRFSRLLDKYFKIERNLSWYKTNPAPHFMKNTYISCSEKIYWLLNKEKKLSDITFNFLNQNEMHDVIETSVCMGNERTSHKTQKPIELIEKLLRIHSEKGDLVLDSFMGSGTVADVCVVMGRDFIGFENDKESIEIMRNERFGLDFKDILGRLDEC